LRSEAHIFERAGAVVFDEHIGSLDQRPQRLHGGGTTQVESDGALVAAIDLPEKRRPAILPGAQRITGRGFDLDHLGAEIAQLQRGHIAGDQTRKIEDANPRKRTLRLGIEASGHQRSLWPVALSNSSALPASAAMVITSPGEKIARLWTTTESSVWPTRT